MENFKEGDIVDLLEGTNVVGKGKIMHMDPNALLHGSPLPSGHFGIAIGAIYKPEVQIPFPPPHEEDVTTLGQTQGYIIAWPRFACAPEAVITSRRSLSSHHSHSSRRSHSSGSSHGSRSSRYTNMSEEDFEAEARKRGWERRERPRERNEEGDSSKKDGGCFDSCFGRGGVRRKDARQSPLRPLREDDGESNFSFNPQTQSRDREAPITIIPTPMETPAETPVETPALTPLKTPALMPAETPVETPIMTPISTSPTRDIYDTHKNLYYTIDAYGDVRSDHRGKRVYSRMHELMAVYFPDDIFTDWRRQPKDSKNMVVQHLHSQFPNPEGMRFNDNRMKARMGHVLKTRRGTARIAAAARDFKPSFLSPDDWQKVRSEHQTFPNRWDQQREANRVQREMTGISRLGSGGRANFVATFESVVGRRPTKSEYEEGRDKGLSSLYQRLAGEGIPLRPIPKTKKYANLTYAAGPNGEIESDGDEDDISYAPSEDDVDTEEEELESEGDDADLWLKDVDMPSSSTRRSRNP